MAIDLLVEGMVDEIVLRAVLARRGLAVGTVYGRRGIAYLRARAEGIAVRGAHGSKVLIVADAMDIPAPCPGEASKILVVNPPPGTLVRLAVNEIEAWLLASRTELAGYLRVPLSRIPYDSDVVADPKQVLVNIARHSRSSRISQMIVPREGVSAVVGVGYVDAVSEFIDERWSLDNAVQVSRSLRKLDERLRERFVA